MKLKRTGIKQPTNYEIQQMKQGSDGSYSIFSKKDSSTSVSCYYLKNSNIIFYFDDIKGYNIKYSFSDNKWRSTKTDQLVFAKDIEEELGITGVGYLEVSFDEIGAIVYSQSYSKKLSENEDFNFGCYLSSTKKIKLNIAKKYSELDFVIVPNLQKKIIEENGVYKPDLGYSGLNEVVVDVYNKNPKYQEKEITPSNVRQEITYDSPNNALSKVIVNKTPIDKIDTITQNGVYTPSEGKFFDEVKVDVFQLNTYDADATENEIFKDKSAYVNGEKIFGKFTINEELNSQEYLIEQIKNVLKTKADAIQPSGTIIINKNGIYNVYDYEFVEINVEPLLENKTVIPSQEEQIIKASSEYQGLNEVIVTPIKTEQKTITKNGSYTPTNGFFFNLVNVEVDDMPKLTTQTVAIADLDAAVYIWDYNGEKTLDYYDGVRQIYSNPTLLQVTASEGQKDFYLFDDGYGADENRQEIIWGAIYINSETGTPDEGFCQSRFLYDIPSREDGFNIDTWGKPINLLGSSVGLYASQSDSVIDFYVGEGDETSITMSPNGINFAANNGDLNLYANSSIYLEAEAGDIVFKSALAFRSGAYFGNNGETHFDGDTFFNSNTSFNGDTTFNNGLTLNGELYLANNGEINDTENGLTIYKGTGSMWLGTEEGGYIVITDGNFFVESFSNLNLVSNKNITLSSQNGSTNFSGNVDFSNANVTGLNVSGGGSGVGKTKISLAKLQTMLSNYNSNKGKIIQIVAKTAVANHQLIIENIGLLQITNKSRINKSVGYTHRSQSGLTGRTFTADITTTTAQLTFFDWEYVIADGVTNTLDSATYSLADTHFDFYVIGE